MAPQKYFYSTVMGWEPSVIGDQWLLKAGLLPDTDIELAGGGGEFFVGDIPGMDAAPPNLREASDDEITTGFASWSSEFEPVQASFLTLGKS